MMDRRSFLSGMATGGAIAMMVTGVVLTLHHPGGEATLLGGARMGDTKVWKVDAGTTLRAAITRVCADVGTTLPPLFIGDGDVAFMVPVTFTGTLPETLDNMIGGFYGAGPGPSWQMRNGRVVVTFPPNLTR